MQVVKTYKFADNTPLLLVLYLPINAANNAKSGRWMATQKRLPSGSINLAYLFVRDLEVKLLAELLDMNAKLLPSDIDRKLRKWKDPDERDFKFSFLLPVGPLSAMDLGRLNADFGCATCGEKSAKRCSQCQAIMYCSSSR